MKPSFLSQQPLSKTVNSSCKSCNRLTEIEGEMVCFREGQIIRLTLIDESTPKLNLLCEGWKAAKLNDKA
ncbi:hypothetical protein [Shewanella glacialipiscicola]|uniref:DUF2158 domain-containing protein n=1 Tax=Shewanella glacialipiscicola TaxID=614069 RepID=A0ABQ6J012_9GAMM|nr:hypothetical protein [Shewanella glacialipiscicola]MCL1086035.1 hypothetical protein [Shewanella glacialipiscicola]MCU7993715.1 hypothetical protein [Shewanella glacialipiscicola]MCU8025033.1 hypothetical protein [Shewanella glacialipiscicola]GIU07974.1 hypothetical protein TUM4636_12060 [Shewanella glacialipiscicola]GMA80793.1 hypothetical protein GCM10025855_03260 [Shewanella glacialipiscicola]